jgi:hypothetical protein
MSLLSQRWDFYKEMSFPTTIHLRRCPLRPRRPVKHQATITTPRFLLLSPHSALPRCLSQCRHSYFTILYSSQRRCPAQKKVIQKEREMRNMIWMIFRRSLHHCHNAILLSPCRMSGRRWIAVPQLIFIDWLLILRMSRILVVSFFVVDI